MATLEAWMQSQGQPPFAWQKEVWLAFLRGWNGLLSAGTGMGKTRAVWLGPLADWCQHPIAPSDWTRVGRRSSPPLLSLWVTPLRALANDTTHALLECIEGLGLPWTLEQRTGDTSAWVKTKQRTAPPTALVITPESLTLMLSYPESLSTFRHLRSVVIDEWHELLGSKRGIQTELALSRLAALAPNHQRWAISATIGNPEEALASLVGTYSPRHAITVTNHDRKPMDVSVLLPERVERFPWAGHIGLAMLPQVIGCIEQCQSTLVFTNTRNQTETWYQSLLRARPDWAGRIAVHHGSLSNDLRIWVENALHDGKLLAVVCTSSLDLGVDFAPVDQVIQIGSPKGIARLLQRAGRSGHQPWRTSRMVFVPSHALEILEIEAAKSAIADRRVESRALIEKPLDCLVQHAVTRSLAAPFQRDAFWNEVRTAYAFRDLTHEELDWVLDFVHTGASLHAYEDFHRVAFDGEWYSVQDASIARRHRMAIGTITSDMAMQVQYLRGAKIGTVEESFASRLKPGDRFLLGGKLLQMEMIREGTVWVRKAKGGPTVIPRWMGGKMPLSSELAAGIRLMLDQVSEDSADVRSVAAIKELLALQRRWSHVPKQNELLVERIETREGTSLILYPFEGRSVSEGLATLLAHRIAKTLGMAFSLSVNDYGFLIHSASGWDLSLPSLAGWLAMDDIEADILSSLNATEMTRRQFRDIARVSGLVHQGIPGQNKSMRHLQASAGMVFDALKQYDPAHRLLGQASLEVLQDQLEWQRLKRSLARMHTQQWVYRRLSRWSPFAFPLHVERMRDRIGSESLTARIHKLQSQLEQAANVETTHDTARA